MSCLKGHCTSWRHWGCFYIVQIARSYAVLPVRLCEDQNLCTPNTDNTESVEGTPRFFCDGYSQTHAIEHVEGTGLPLGCVSGD